MTLPLEQKLQQAAKPTLQAQCFEWVDSDEHLHELCALWSRQKAIALDTEFIRTDTFYPIIGLLQIADKQGIYLIDPLAISDKAPLHALWKDKRVTKVIHSCSEDLEVFNRYLGVLPTPLFDTQIAAAFAGFGASLGYANLVSVLFDEAIPKDETRSDWLQRPLSEAQLNYAALDVAHLLAIFEKLSEQLSTQQRLEWVNLECSGLIDKAGMSDDVSQYYLRIKSSWKLQPKQLAVLKALSSWREGETRHINIPRNRLLKDSALFDIAQRLPRTKEQLLSLGDVHHRFVKKYGDHCLTLLASVLNDESNYPNRLPAPLNAQQRDLFKILKARVLEVAEKLDLPPEFLIRKKDLESIIRKPQQTLLSLPAPLKGWREDIVAKPLLALLSEYMSR